MWKTVFQDDFIARTYGNLAEKFDRPVVSWKLRGSFNALEATWKDEKLSYELFLFETNGRLSLAGDIDIFVGGVVDKTKSVTSKVADFFSELEHFEPETYY